ncbi:hypothetical protein LEP1GSC058_2121 [Leptospira fainei serovar Hurstbridge str. BUT 6]|uniref:Lipoprotein n=1 Tax=Leptospira fainei serovar Hurstbridge str. BUT 6 TaxID=1193011 RepID=S3VFQ8_9LEPT|nr:hypothetical protein [Leptospira fainei]EPG75330.1 hypothetical protein LEP1GSC058_2121 [Leptospira fainei serovar Hurstbridge str. BUT 6]
MSKKIIVLSLLGFLFADCKLDSDVLASFKGGTLTRKELRLHYFYSLKGRKVDETTASVENQNKVLEELSLLKIAELYNKDHSLVSEGDMERFLKYSEPQFAFSLYRKKFEDQITKEGKVRMAFIRVLLVASPDSATGKTLKQKADDYLEQLKKLSSKKDVAQFVSEHTEEPQRKSVSGVLEPACLDCGNDPLSAILSKAAENKGQWILEESAGKIYILRSERLENIYLARLEKLFKNELGKQRDSAKDYLKKDNLSEDDKKNSKFYSELRVEEIAGQYADYYKNKFLAEAWKKSIDQVMTESGWEPAQISQANIGAITPETVLLTDKKTGEVVRYKEVLEKFKDFAAISGGDATPTKDEKSMVINFYSSRYLPLKIGERSEAIKRIRNSEEYKELFPIQRRFLVLPLLMKKVFPPKIDVTEAEIRTTYEAGKMFSYSKPNPANQQERIPLPFADVREKIRQELLDSKKQSLAQEFIGKLKSEYQLTVATEQLKPGKI